MMLVKILLIAICIQVIQSTDLVILAFDNRPAKNLSKDKEDEVGQKEFEQMKKNKPKDYQQLVMSIQAVLGRLGYGTGPFTGIMDEKTRTAIQKYQSNAGLKQSEDLDYLTFKKLMDDMEATEALPVGLPSLSVYVDMWNDFASAQGTWVISNEKQAFPLQTTKITCYRESNSCIETTAVIMLGKSLTLDSNFIGVERWDNFEIVTKPYDYLCTRYVIRINKAQKTVTAIRSTLNSKEVCEGVEGKEMHLTLSDGFKVWWELEETRRAVMKKVLLID